MVLCQRKLLLIRGNWFYGQLHIAVHVPSSNNINIYWGYKEWTEFELGMSDDTNKLTTIYWC